MVAHSKIAENGVAHCWIAHIRPGIHVSAKEMFDTTLVYYIFMSQLPYGSTQQDIRE